MVFHLEMTSELTLALALEFVVHSALELIVALAQVEMCRAPEVHMEV
jgi:hypothetical protein